MTSCLLICNGEVMRKMGRDAWNNMDTLAGKCRVDVIVGVRQDVS